MPQVRVALIRIEITPEGNMNTNITGQATPAEVIWAMEDLKRALLEQAHKGNVSSVNPLLGMKGFNPRVVS